MNLKIQEPKLTVWFASPIKANDYIYKYEKNFDFSRGAKRPQWAHYKIISDAVHFQDSKTLTFRVARQKWILPHIFFEKIFDFQSHFDPHTQTRTQTGGIDFLFEQLTYSPYLGINQVWRSNGQRNVHRDH